MNDTGSRAAVHAQGGGYPPGGYAPPGGGGYGPPGAPPPGWGPPGSPPPGGYGAPGGYGPPAGPPFGGGFAPPPFQPSGGPGLEALDAIAFGWTAVMKDYAGVAVPLAVAAFLSVLPAIVLSGVRGVVVGALSVSHSVDATVITLINIGGGVLNWLIGIVAQSFLLGGVVQFTLRVARGEKPDFGVIFSGGRAFGPMFIATLIYVFCGNVGIAACVVPGLFLSGVWAVYSTFIVDQGMGGIEALNASFRATAPYRVNALIYALLAFLILFAGLLACCVGILLVSFPVLAMANAYVYLKLIGEQPRLPSA